VRRNPQVRGSGGREERGEHALEGAGGDQHAEAGRHAADGGGGGEAGSADEEGGFAAEEVGETAAEQEQ